MASEDHLPTEEEISQLPRWARVAFAVRCAERVLPVFDRYWQDKPRLASLTLLQAVDMARGAAAVGGVPDRRAYHGIEAATSSWVTNALNDEDAHVASAHAADCALNALRAVRNESNQHAHDAASHAWHAARYPAPGDASIRIAMQRDIAAMLELAHADNWADDTPVDPDALGPLWPDGEPKGWPKSAVEQGSNGSYLLEFESPDGVSDAEAAERIARVIGLLDRLNRAKGGTGVRIDDEIGTQDRVVIDSPLPVGGWS